MLQVLFSAQGCWCFPAELLIEPECIEEFGGGGMGGQCGEPCIEAGWRGRVGPELGELDELGGGVHGRLWRGAFGCRETILWEKSSLFCSVCLPVAIPGACKFTLIWRRWSWGG